MTSPSISVASWSADRAGGTVRLTARGRALLVVLLGVAVAILAVAVLFVVGARMAAADTAAVVPEAGGPVQPGAVLAARGLAHPHVVVAGDTLWDLATALDPAADPRVTIDRIQRLNGLAGSDLVIGRTLWLPVPAAQEG